MIERSTQLKECLDKMSGDMEHGIYKQWNDIYPRGDNEQPSKYRWRQRMLEDSQRLTAAARQALRIMATDTGAVQAFRTLMDQLLEIFESATNEPVTRMTKHDDDAVPYREPIVKFVEDCLGLASIVKSNSAVGQQLKAAIDRK